MAEITLSYIPRGTDVYFITLHWEIGEGKVDKITWISDRQGDRLMYDIDHSDMWSSMLQPDQVFLDRETAQTVLNRKIEQMRKNFR